MERTLSREAYALLAQANLLRMRGAWPESIEKCMEALRLSPDNPSAQSLLGDVYENQGRLDDAIQWYRMALDVQPDSPADRLKLSRLLDLKARDLAPLVPVKPADSASEASPSPERAPLLARWRSDPDAILRRFASVAGVLAVLVVLTALVLAHRTFSPGVGPKQVDAPPVIVPSVVTAPPVGTTPDAAPVFADPTEAAIVDALRAAPSVTGLGCSVVSAQIDPRAGRLTLTVAYSPPVGVPPHRESVLRAVSGVLQAALPQTDAQTITQFTARCLLSSPTGGSTPLIFTADSTRPAIAALNPNLALLSADQIAAAYSNPWWASVPAQ